MTIGEKIRTTRQAMGLELKDMTELTGISPANLSLIERNLQSANWSSLKRIFEVLKIEVIAPTIVVETGSTEKIIIHKKDLTSWYIKRGETVQVTDDFDLIKKLCE